MIRPFLAVFPKRKRLQWQIFAPAASPSVSRHGASLQVSPESARNQLSTGGPETPFFLLLLPAQPRGAPAPAPRAPAPIAPRAPRSNPL